METTTSPDVTEVSLPDGAPLITPPPRSTLPDSEQQTRCNFIMTVEEQRALGVISVMQKKEYAVLLRERTLTQIVAEYRKLKKLFVP
jgi:hypothetical protein